MTPPEGTPPEKLKHAPQSSTAKQAGKQNAEASELKAKDDAKAASKAAKKPSKRAKPADDEVAAAFAKYNCNEDGLLGLDELTVLLEDANYHVDDSYVDGLAGMFGKWDADGSGGIEMAEFRELWEKLGLGGMLAAARPAVSAQPQEKPPLSRGREAPQLSAAHRTNETRELAQQQAGSAPRSLARASASSNLVTDAAAPTFTNQGLSIRDGAEHIGMDVNTEGFSQGFRWHNQRAAQQQLLQKELVKMPHLATGPKPASDHVLTTHSATPGALQDAQHNMTAAKHLLNAGDFAAVAGALRVAALNFVQPLSGSELPIRARQLLCLTLLQYLLGFGVFTACRRFVKSRRQHLREEHTAEAIKFGICLGLLADALSCWCFVAPAMEERHKVTLLRHAATMHVNMGNFVSAIRVVGYIRRLDGSANVAKLVNQCKAKMSDSAGFRSKVVAGKELESVESSIQLAIEGCKEIGHDVAEAINLLGLTKAYRAHIDQNHEDMHAAKDTLRRAYSLTAVSGDIRKEAEVLLNLGIIFRGLTDEKRRAAKVALEVRELDSRAINLGKPSLLHPKRSLAMLAKEQKDDKGIPPRWTLASSSPSLSWGKTVEAEAPEIEDEVWGEIDAKFKGKTLHQIFDMYDTDRSGIIGGFEVAAVFKDAAGEYK